MCGLIVYVIVADRSAPHLPPSEGAGPTVWHSVAASALGVTSQKPTISRAKRSTAMPCWVAARSQCFLLYYTAFSVSYQFFVEHASHAASLPAASRDSPRLSSLSPVADSTRVPPCQRHRLDSSAGDDALRAKWSTTESVCHCTTS